MSEDTRIVELNDRLQRIVQGELVDKIELSGQGDSIDGVIESVNKLIDSLGTKAFLEKFFRRLSHEDGLTNLANRVLFQERLQRAMLRTDRYGFYTALLFVDLDGFQSLREQHGDPIAKLILRHIGSQIHKSVRGSDTVSRLQEDEFVVVLEQSGGAESIEGIVERILGAVNTTISLGSESISVDVRIGISTYPLDAKNTEGLLWSAEQAVTYAKENDKPYTFFEKLHPPSEEQVKS